MRFYKHILEHVSIDPAGIIFVDDKSENVLPASLSASSECMSSTTLQCRAALKYLCGWSWRCLWTIRNNSLKRSLMTSRECLARALYFAGPTMLMPHYLSQIFRQPRASLTWCSTGQSAYSSHAQLHRQNLLFSQQPSNVFFVSIVRIRESNLAQDGKGVSARNVMCAYAIARVLLFWGCNESLRYSQYFASLSFRRQKS